MAAVISVPALSAEEISQREFNGRLYRAIISDDVKATQECVQQFLDTQKSKGVEGEAARAVLKEFLTKEWMPHFIINGKSGMIQAYKSGGFIGAAIWGTNAYEDGSVIVEKDFISTSSPQVLEFLLDGVGIKANHDTITRTVSHFLHDLPKFIAAISYSTDSPIGTSAQTLMNLNWGVTRIQAVKYTLQSHCTQTLKLLINRGFTVEENCHTGHLKSYMSDNKSKYSLLEDRVNSDVRADAYALCKSVSSELLQAIEGAVAAEQPNRVFRPSVSRSEVKESKDRTDQEASKDAQEGPWYTRCFKCRAGRAKKD